MSAVFEIAGNPLFMTREQDRFSASLRDLDDAVPSANRTQNRAARRVPEATTVLRHTVAEATTVPEALEGNAHSRRPLRQHPRHRPGAAGEPRLGARGDRGRRRLHPRRRSHQGRSGEDTGRAWQAS